MKFYAINGSPRKTWNTATLLQSALDGIRSAVPGDGVETELIHLHDIGFTSCTSCFECKRLGGRSYGHCVLRDPLRPILEKVSQADGVIFGSPIYLGNVTGMLRSFMERLLFPFSVYDLEHSSIAPRRMPTAFLYTMNIPEAMMEDMQYKIALRDLETFTGRIFSPPEVMYAFNTYQFDDYGKYKMEMFKEEEKAAYREKHFPLDKEKAFAMGAALAAKALDRQEQS